MGGGKDAAESWPNKGSVGSFRAAVNIRAGNQLSKRKDAGIRGQAGTPPPAGGWGGGSRGGAV